MNRDKLYTILKDQQRQFRDISEHIVNRTAVKQVMELIKNKMPLTITGIRRCGKSTLLKIIATKLKLSAGQYLYINFNDERLLEFDNDDFQKIIDYMQENRYETKAYLFIDEIQEVSNWEKWIDRIKDEYTILITGSNSKLLSKEISTHLTGRNISLTLYPFSFEEFLIAKQFDYDDWHHDIKKHNLLRALFNEYLKTGGFPKRVITGSGIIITELYENIIYRDIISRFSKSLVGGIKGLGLYVMSNPSLLYSYRNLASILNIKKIATIKSIMQSFESAFLTFSINKFDYSLKKQLVNQRKIYVIDNGFIDKVGFAFSENKGRFLENLVAIELRRRNNDFYYFKETNECDFVIKEKTKIVLAIQVCYDFNDKVKERELNGLNEAMDKFKLKEGVIVTCNQEEELKIGAKKIIIKPAWKWLIEAQHHKTNK